MSQFDDLMATYTGALNDTPGVSDADITLLTAVAKGLGPSIYNKDSSTVACSDKEELDRVRKSFLVGKLGCADNDSLDASIKEVCEQMGSSNRNKYRPVFYYLLVKKLGKESVYA